MATFLRKEWSKKELLSFIGDPHQLAGARPSILTDGKGEGVKAIDVNTGAGMHFMVLPGRGMDIPEAFYKGKTLHFFSGTGITSPAYYEEPGLGWLRSFFVGLLTTCGITYSGAPDVDQGKSLGLHGRVSNAAAENVCVNEEWVDDDYVITLQGMIRESSAMGENMTMTRRIETRLGWKGFTLSDVIENRGFEPQPLMMLYHFNFGFPLLAPNARVVGPIVATEPRDEEARKEKGVEECLTFPEPQLGYMEKVFFHRMASDSKDRTFVALLNRDTGDGTPLGAVIRFNRKELPTLTEWKMVRKGFYVLGLEPGTALPLGRGKVREKGELPFLEGQEEYRITIEFQVVDSLDDIEGIEKEGDILKEV